ncbi:UNKNOWN [Stylonychia lemnae]|uniref:Transmembrane protein n=1 Tax=Stylonychia lemnae TaxID=5949 RepID=A0A077ZRU6_STYLE|nr:UNKNOWN [Stylonychia lemnae]|eukprot:CDW72199.1 UNKNOWN [Stylonychia lemnae]
MSSKVYLLIFTLVFVSLHFSITNSVQQRSLSQNSFQRPAFLSETADSNQNPRFLAQKSSGRFRTSSIVYVGGGRYYYSGRSATFGETMIGLGVIVAFILVAAAIVWTCEKCGCCKKHHEHHDEHEHK